MAAEALRPAETTEAWRDLSGLAEVATAAPALKEAGCEHLYLAGRPRDEYEQAGVDAFVTGAQELETYRRWVARLRGGVLAEARG